MYISHLQLKGFKSFGGAHELPLASGMTAIVGPNGSGKSNLLDALRWVLGDSHASKLRISRQGDLLFQGSISQQKAREAEVAIRLKDENRLCTLRRRVLSDGTTQMFVDNMRKTLLELEETKRLWHLDGDRFAFIGQGEVAEVIQQRPSARRVQLEALFGIDIYRKRRIEAEEHLGKTSEEYDRLRNFSAELAVRRASIAPEVERASKVREILTVLEAERVLLYWVRRKRLEELFERAGEELKKIDELKKHRHYWAHVWKMHVAFHEGKLSSFWQTHQAQEKEIQETRTLIENFKRQGYTHGTSLHTSKKRRQQILLEKSSHQNKKISLCKEQEETQNSYRIHIKTLETKKTELERVEQLWKAQEENRQKNKEAWESLNRERGRAEADLQQLKARMSALGKSLLDIGKGQSKERTEKIKLIKKEQGNLEKRHLELLEAQEKTAVQYRDCYACLQQTTVELQKKKRELSHLNSKLGDLSEQAQSELYPKPVQHILSAVRLGRLKAQPVAVIDAFSCPEELAGAVEAYLGARQYWMLVKDMEEARRCIDQLKTNAMGRATFLPLERCRPRRPDTAFRLFSGVVGWGISLIASQQKWMSAMEHIMGDLLVVEEYSVGQTLLRQGFRFPVVTLDGDVFQPAGSISGGKNKKSGKAIEIKSAIKKLEGEVLSLQDNVKLLSQQFAEAEKDEERLSREKETISVSVRQLAEERSSLNDQWEALVREKERMRGERDNILETLRDGGKQYSELKRRLSAMTATDEYQEGTEDLTLFRESETLKSTVAIVDERVRSSVALLDRLAAEIRTHKIEINQLEDELQELEKREIADRSALSHIGRRYHEVYLRRTALQAEMIAFEKDHARLVRLKDRRQMRLKTAEDRTAQIEKEHILLEQKKEDMQRELQELIASWEEQYPYSGSVEVHTIDLDEQRKKIRELERGIKALGEVDMGVLSEDRSLQERLTFLAEQLDDVRQGMADLQRLIDEADMQAKVIFSNALDEIDRRFNDLFQHLFGGGEAHLELIEGNTLWDSGVDVVARPPGKHPQSITQLSGGEQSLSAISLLFSALEVANSPIAVLDEVDAALDEVNLRRFADLTRDNARNRQIFVMTHRRVTMERADVLYGVTLSEPGLSQVIGVRVEDWA